MFTLEKIVLVTAVNCGLFFNKKNYTNIVVPEFLRL